MFEITKNDKDTFDLYLDDRRVYPDSIYDFTFENRYIIYHIELKNNTVYLALDMQTEHSSKVMDKRRGPYREKNFPYLIPYILDSIKYLGDRRYTNIFAENPIEVIDLIFRDVLPHFGYAIREEQIKLSKKMFVGLTRKKVAICEAEVGTGKSLAYLVAALCAKRYEESLYNYSSPVTITTSNIELQTALVEREIPILSRMLVQYHIIDQPLKTVIRKGKEHYFCLFRYYDYINNISKYPEKFQEQLEYFESTAFDKKAFDLDKLKLTPYIKSKICIKGRCYACAYMDDCKYINYVRSSMSSRNLIDFQVTNHNLYINSTEQDYILRYSSYVVIDEAHKLKEAASDIYGNSICEDDVIKYLNWVKVFCNENTDNDKFKEHCQEVERYNHLLFAHLKRLVKDGTKDNMITLDYDMVQIIKSLSDEIVTVESFTKRRKGRAEISAVRLVRALSDLSEIEKNSIWLETDENGLVSLCCAPKDVGGKLNEGVWGHGVSHVLTSGTMSDGANFVFFKEENGLDQIKSEDIIEISTPSPFDYKNNTRLYIPTDMPRPNNDDENYINAVAEKIIELVDLTNGHTAILFTSYKVLSAVFTIAKDRLARYDLICMTRSNKTAITDFKKSKNGVLFASGSMWEGVDCIGDILSSVIIVRLPFPIRSAMMEEKKRSCKNVAEFIYKYAVPEMLIKLRQGAGRLIRCETDTGLLTILDSRAINGRYAKRIENALAKYPRVNSIEEARAFLESVKDKEYFEQTE